MPGQVKKGLGTLVGNAGEYYVVAELLKRKRVAAWAHKKYCPTIPWLGMHVTCPQCTALPIISGLALTSAYSRSSVARLSQALGGRAHPAACEVP